MKLTSQTTLQILPIVTEQLLNKLKDYRTTNIVDLFIQTFLMLPLIKLVPIS